MKDLTIDLLGYTSGGGADGAGVFAALGVFLFLYLGLIVLVIVGLWKVFTKAGKPGWAAIVPVYNIIVLLEIAGRPIWWIIFFLVPILNIAGIVFWIILCLDVAKSFGKGGGFGVGLALLGFIFYPILGFSDATYRGPAAAQGMA